jgi:hypothetical protein
MKLSSIKHLLAFVFLVNNSFGQGFLPMYHKLPAKGQFTKISRMKINRLISAGSGIDLNEKECSNYYGVLEFGENFCQYSIYSNNGTLILKSFGDPSKDLFIRKSFDKNLGESKYNLASSSPYIKGELTLEGNINYPKLLKQRVSFYFTRTNPHSEQIEEGVMMEYEYN